MAGDPINPLIALILQRPCFRDLRKLAHMVQPGLPQPMMQQPAMQQPMPPALPAAQPQPLGPAVAHSPQPLRPLATLLPHRPPTSGHKATAMPGTPGHAATNVIDQLGGLDASGRTVDGNNAAGVRKGASLARYLETGKDLPSRFKIAILSPTGDYLPKGWQMRALQQPEEAGASQWTPRIFSSPATPLTEMLADPKKQSLLYALLGGGLGAAAGAAGGALGAGNTPMLAAAGGGLGAAIGGIHGYGSRVRKNDQIMDALRRTPPGATVRDFDDLQEKDRMG